MLHTLTSWLAYLGILLLVAGIIVARLADDPSTAIVGMLMMMAGVFTLIMHAIATILG